MKPVPAKLFFPPLAAALLLAAFPLFAQEAQEAQEAEEAQGDSSVVRYIEAQDRIIRDPCKDPAHHRHRVARNGNRAWISWWGIPSTGT